MLKFIPRLNISRKLTLVCLAFLLPDFVLMCLFLVTINGYINFGRQELAGNQYLRPLEELLDFLPQHLRMSRRSLAGDAPSKQQLPTIQASVDAAFERLTNVDARFGELLQFTDEGLRERHRENCHAGDVAHEWSKLKDWLSKMDQVACEAAHRRLLDALRAMISHAGDTSNLILDPDLDSYYLMDVALLALPQMQDRLATLMQIGEERLSKGGLTDAEQREFQIAAAMLAEADLARIVSSARTTLIEDHNFYGTSKSLQGRLPPTIEACEAATKAFIELVRRAGSNANTVTSAEFVEAGSAARRASFNLWKVAVDELDGLLQTRIRHFEHRRALSLLLAGMAFTAAISLARFITRSISRPLERQADELRRANDAILESEKRARALIEAAPDCVVTMDGAGKIVEFNRAAERTFGYSRDKAVGRDVADLIVPHRYRAAHVQGLRRYLQTGEGPILGKGLELAARRADGTEFPIEIAASAITGQDGHIFIAFISDITQRKASENELKRLYAETELLLKSIASVLIHLDSRGVVTRWNSAAELVFGIVTADALGKSCRSLPWGDADIPMRLEALAAQHENERFPHVVVKRSDGSQRILELTVNPICSEGQCSGVLVLGNDRTEQEQLEVSLRQAQKLESIGQLAAGVAHEINTPMQFVCNNLEYLSECSKKLFEVVDNYQDNLAECFPEKSWQSRLQTLAEITARNQFDFVREQLPIAINEGLEGARRVIDIVRAMKEFSHPGSQERTNLNLNEAIRSTATITRNRWKYVADLELDLDPSLPMLLCLPAEINQVLLNLIVNAADAIDDDRRENSDEVGKITIRTRAGEGSVVIEVEDSGCGIPTEIRSRIFDPFFTTKDVGKGSGQGLAICYNVVVNKHHGAIDVHSEHGIGTTFRVTLPLTSENAEGSSADLSPVGPLLEAATV